MNFTNHALSRMEERNISKEKVLEMLRLGQTFSSSNGTYIVKYLEVCGSITRNYRIIYSKRDDVVITVFCFEKRFDERNALSKNLTKNARKIYKQKKNNAKQMDADAYYKESLKQFR